ncbi:hypothetical protein C8R45DRAFT_1103109 [Mycena sanguinolenta]|nr:hypothetical protein C8R45DRAFT_1103109 [Mycena sanguinolenta]
MECTLVFNYTPAKLTKDVNLMLTFNEPTDKALSNDQNLVAWKVLSLRQGTNPDVTSQVSVTYSPSLAFGLSRLQNGGNIVYGSETVKVKLGDTVKLEMRDKIAQWGNTTKDATTKLIQAMNDTGMRQNITVGTIEENGAYSPTFLWKVGSGQTAEAEFHPNLNAYMNLDYKQSQFITGDLKTTKAVAHWNLSALSAITEFRVTEDGQGGYQIDQI